jgi:aspartate ammonia-lyase
VTALNPLIGYNAAADLAKEALQSDRSVKELALQKAEQGQLIHRKEQRPVLVSEVHAALDNLYQMSEGGILFGEKGERENKAG